MGIDYNINHKNIYLDANIFIYLLEGYTEFTVLLEQLFEKIDQGILNAITSELTLAETLVKPMMDQNNALQKIYANTLQTSSTLNVVPITREILKTAAKLRTKATRMPDAIHLATAHLTDCKLFVTNDKRLRNSNHLEIIILSDIKNFTFTI